MLDDVLKEYLATRQLPDGRWIGVHRLLYHYSFHIDIDECGYADSYCYMELGDALEALETWSGEGDPLPRWHRHPKTGRRRNLVTGEEWIQL